jgi:hypothetical protein
MAGRVTHFEFITVAISIIYALSIAHHQVSQ